MHRRFKQPAGTSIRLYALGAIFLVPLSIGVLLVTSNASQNDNAYQISHDVASMYAQGLNFSQRPNPVSYTHLDVYKRQIPHRRPFGWGCQQ